MIRAISAALLLLALTASSQPPAPQQQRLPAGQEGAGTQQQTPSGPPTTGVVQTPTTTTNPNSTPPYQHPNQWSDPITILTGALVLATTVYVAVAIGQLRAIRRQAEIAERHITELERPWIIVEPVNPSWSLQGTAFPRDYALDANVYNHGRSPAWILAADMKLDVLPLPLSDEPEYRREPSTRHPITPQGPKACRQQIRTITDAERMRILNGQAVVVFYGMVEYEDVAGTPHATRFCFIYEDRPVGPGKFVWGGPPAWNRYT